MNDTAKHPESLDLSGYSLDALDTLAQQIAQEKIAARERIVERTRAQIESALHDAGLDASDLASMFPALGRRAPAAARKRAAKGLYRHPDKPKLTWTGIGRVPKWVQELKAQGYSLDQLKV